MVMAMLKLMVMVKVPTKRVSKTHSSLVMLNLMVMVKGNEKCKFSVFLFENTYTTYVSKRPLLVRTFISLFLHNLHDIYAYLPPRWT